MIRSWSNPEFSNFSWSDRITGSTLPNPEPSRINSINSRKMNKCFIIFKIRLFPKPGHLTHNYAIICVQKILNDYVLTWKYVICTSWLSFFRLTSYGLPMLKKKHIKIYQMFDLTNDCINNYLMPYLNNWFDWLVLFIKLAVICRTFATIFYYFLWL